MIITPILLDKREADVNAAVDRGYFVHVGGEEILMVNDTAGLSSDIGEAVRARWPRLAFVACYQFAGSPSSPDRSVRYSLRSVRDDVDVSAIAKRHGGGGHAKAAGFEIPDDGNVDLVWPLRG